jgi:hypothetical protein
MNQLSKAEQEIIMKTAEQVKKLALKSGVSWGLSEELIGDLEPWEVINLILIMEKRKLESLLIHEKVKG